MEGKEQPVSGVIKVAPIGEDYAIIIDSSYEAVLLRDLLQNAAQKAHLAASKATQRNALNRQTDRYECFSKYAERCEYIRLQEVERIGKQLGVS
jgi:hypothetical protein